MGCICSDKSKEELDRNIEKKEGDDEDTGTLRGPTQGILDMDQTEDGHVEELVFTETEKQFVDFWKPQEATIRGDDGAERGECAVCFEPLSENCPAVLQNESGDRSCRHFVCHECAEELLESAPLCPLCRTDFKKVTALPEFSKDPAGWFKLVSNEKGKLSKEDVLLSLNAILPVASTRIATDIDIEWPKWDHDAEDFVHVEHVKRSLIPYVKRKLNLVRFQKGKIPDISKAENAARWFDYWDWDSRGRLAKHEIARAMLKTFSTLLQGQRGKTKIREMCQGLLIDFWPVIALDLADPMYVELGEFIGTDGLGQTIQQLLWQTMNQAPDAEDLLEMGMSQQEIGAQLAQLPPSSTSMKYSRSAPVNHQNALNPFRDSGAHIMAPQSSASVGSKPASGAPSPEKRDSQLEIRWPGNESPAGEIPRPEPAPLSQPQRPDDGPVAKNDAEVAVPLAEQPKLQTISCEQVVPREALEPQEAPSDQEESLVELKEDEQKNTASELELQQQESKPRQVSRPSKKKSAPPPLPERVSLAIRKGSGLPTLPQPFPVPSKKNGDPPPAFKEPSPSLRNRENEETGEKANNNPFESPPVSPDKDILAAVNGVFDIPPAKSLATDGPENPEDNASGTLVGGPGALPLSNSEVNKISLPAAEMEELEPPSPRDKPSEASKPGHKPTDTEGQIDLAVAAALSKQALLENEEKRTTTDGPDTEDPATQGTASPEVLELDDLLLISGETDRSDDPLAEPPSKTGGELPDWWMKKSTPDGDVFYQNNWKKQTAWEPPSKEQIEAERAQGADGWERTRQESLKKAMMKQQRSKSPKLGSINEIST